jgi:glycosyltransferase involved in cell wall biosynthesis
LISEGVSVIIPVHNRRELLIGRSLPSVLGQTRAADEVIVVDDGSTDGMAEAVAERWPEVMVIRQPNRGVSAARNAGVAASSGEWIAFLDSDDEWLPEKLEVQLAGLRSPELNPERLRVCHTNEKWLRNGKPLRQRRHHRKSGGWIFERCLELCCMSPSSVMLQRSVWVDVGGFDESLPACEDYDLWLRISARMPVLYLEAPLLIKHGGHDDQLSMKYPLMDSFRVQALEKLMADETVDVDKRDLAVAELRKRLEWLIAGAEKHANHEIKTKYVAKLRAIRLG